MTIQEMAQNVLNVTRFGDTQKWTIPSNKRSKIAERFRLVWCAPDSFWEREEDTVMLENGNYCLIDHAREIDDRWYHVSDLNECDRCEELNRPCNMGRVRVNGSRMAWCVSCSESHAFECSNCGGLFDENESCERNGELFCENCAPSEDEMEIHSYHSQSRKYIPSGMAFHPFWSIELEMELGTQDDRSDFVKQLREDDNLKQEHIITERDGSLCNEKGIEVIFSLYEDKQSILNDIALVQAYAKENGGLSWNLYKRRGRYAGCHINRNKAGWTNHELMRLCYLVERLRHELIELSGRNCTSYAAYSDNYYGTNGRRLRDLARGNQGKYSALNLSSSGRIEWRMFSGSLSLKRVQAYCMAVEALEGLAKGNEKAHDLERLGRIILKSINSQFTK
ncbi:LIM domain containing protein [uncultured Caudovirales phage]|uniref:LIM domain containing protein n=1 Tax=uncultured Caudovirales phage TaxID=2100421 RepID=A0A6J7X2B6_9CAUD|nr:LIM domain containing protein [uncultured Caudovirales phage]